MASIPFATPDSTVSNVSNVNSESLAAPKASQACLSCRRQKRRCDKKLPACSLCERMSRPCDYSDASPAPTAEDFNALRQKLTELEGRLLGAGGHGSVMSPGLAFQPTPAVSLSASSDGAHHSPVPYVLGLSYHQIHVHNRFPAIAFLDSESFIHGRVEVPLPQIDIPLDVLELLGDGSAVQVVVSDYFATIHTWMPIVSKKRLSRNMLNPLWEAGPDLALLFLTMKLIISRPQEGLDNWSNPVYSAAKRFLALMEASGMVSLMVLQAYVLVALYEIGQSIYPSAWMSVGACVRYGQILGIHDEDAPQLLVQASTWTEIEERRRSWWAVIIIDRIVTVGSLGRFIACEDPAPNTPLPLSTSVWDEGQVAVEPTYKISTDFTTSVCPFARLCQAANMLGKVLRHHRLKNVQEDERFRQASTLYVELSDLARILVQEASTSPDYLAMASPMAVCFSALCFLCDPYACQALRPPSNTPEEATMQVQAVEGLKSVSEGIRDFSEQIVARTPHSLDIDRVSLFVIDSLYAAAANFAWDVRESGSETSQASLDNIRQCLRRFVGRWRSSQEFLRILEAQEFTYAVGSG